MILPTTCKTWGCTVCRRKLLGLFRARVEHGVSTLGRCCFITITYQAENNAARTVPSVGKDWTALWKRLRRDGQQWAWLRVVELTKKKVPHHHVVVGPVTGRMRCHGDRIRKGKQTSEYIRRIPSCDCVAHIFARAWLAVTGDSFMCFAIEVDNAVGAGGYLAKYVDKTFVDREWKGRRYTTSRQWPGGGKLQLRVTLEGGWDHIRMWPGAKFGGMGEKQLNPHEADLLDRVGTDLMFAIRRRISRKAAKKYFEGVLGHDIAEG